ncbi:DnaB-like helicase C-terminal domain-containing protein [Oceanispirochaeta sp.]|uniref:DnaB-like helicase C-terminal domain-containing protein n=1 Tax=Oceanispirochaeta sp. TaxID=2035350 RepID=UPI0026050F03|nr:DnaB-like helicase C-terminal domain-containing protein [Oceanispirochaeta sp.]MDA3956657.1 DnaB-like helicase C-terminal domain-containing protein [Oceanispirochaeta sp.]
MTGGFQNKLLYYIGGRPSDGKSAALNGFALSAVKSGYRPGIITVESSANEILSRTASSASGVPLTKIKAGTLTPAQISYLIESGTELNDIDPVVYDEPNATLQTVCTQARRMVSVYGCKILFIDYVQQITPDVKGVVRNEQIADISKALKSLARSLDVPIVSAAQLRRPKDAGKHNRPIIDDFGDSSQLEKDADGAGLLHHGIDSDSGNAYSFLHWDKNRDGDTKSIPVFFNKEIVRFEEKNV